MNLESDANISIIGTSCGGTQTFQDVKSRDAILISYKGGGYGIPLFEPDPTLQNIMMNWYEVK